MLSYKFAAYFQNTFLSKHLWRAASEEISETNYTPQLTRAFYHYFIADSDSFRDRWQIALIGF